MNSRSFPRIALASKHDRQPPWGHEMATSIAVWGNIEQTPYPLTSLWTARSLGHAQGYGPLDDRSPLPPQPITLSIGVETGLAGGRYGAFCNAWIKNYTFG